MKKKTIHSSHRIIFLDITDTLGSIIPVILDTRIINNIQAKLSIEL